MIVLLFNSLIGYTYCQHFHVHCSFCLDGPESCLKLLNSLLKSAPVDYHHVARALMTRVFDLIARGRVMVKLLETIIAIALVTCAVFEDVLVCVQLLLFDHHL